MNHIIKPDRLDWFEDQIFRKNTHRQMVERLASKRFHISARQARKYIAAAKERWLAFRDEHAEEIRAELDAGLREQYQRADAKGKHSAAIRALVYRGQLHGVMGPTEANITLTASAEATVNPPLSDKERERLAELEAAEKAKGAP